MPTEKDEVWRYSRIDQLDLDRYRPIGAPGAPAEAPGPSLSDRVRAVADALGPRAGLVVTIDGVLATVASAFDDADLAIGRIAEREDAGSLLGSVANGSADLVHLNDAFAADPLVVSVPAGTAIEDPVVVVHVVSGADGGASFPRTLVRVGDGARLGVVELVVEAGTGLLADPSPADLSFGPPGSGAADRVGHLVVPVTELSVADRAELAYVSVQSTGPAAWQIAHQASTIGADAVLRSFSVGLGGSYARLRTDSSLDGTSGSSVLRAAYLGRDEQMLDFRTLQDHAAPRTTSDLLFKGAVADRAHSVYSGLIRVRRGAVRADAMQTNHNLVLDEGAHADSVPNLDIEENDVRCSHGSTVGPVDEDQRYYLESRGVEPEVAERLIVAGFFDDIAGQVPIAGARSLVGRALAARLEALDA